MAVRRLSKSAEFKREWTKLSRKLRLEHPACEKCGATEKLLVHHILIRRLYPEYALDPRNLIVLCPKCHNFKRGSAHKDGIVFAEWLRTAKPEQYAEILEMSRT